MGIRSLANCQVTVRVADQDFLRYFNQTETSNELAFVPEKAGVEEFAANVDGAGSKTMPVIAFMKRLPKSYSQTDLHDWRLEVNMVHKLKNKTRRDGLTFMMLAFVGGLVFGRLAFTDFMRISLTAPLEKVVFDFALLGAMYSFVVVPIAVAALFGWMLWSRPNG